MAIAMQAAQSHSSQHIKQVDNIYIRISKQASVILSSIWSGVQFEKMKITWIAHTVYCRYIICSLQIVELLKGL